MSDSLRPHGLQHARLACPSLSPSLLKLMSIESWCHATISFIAPFSFSLQSFLASGPFSMNRLFASGWPKNWSSSISPSSEYSGLISLRIDWFDLLAVQRTLKSLLQHHNSKVPILQHSVFFMVQLSHQFMTTGKTKALTIQIFVGKVTSLLFMRCLGWS